jgi:hypothetical protein
MSVFSQSKIEDDVVEAVSTKLATTTIESEAVTIEDNSKTDVQKSIVITTVYPTEKLPSDEAFKDFVVGPGRFSLELAPGESKVVEMVISNRMGERKRFSITTEDAQGSSDPSQAVVLMGEARGPYTIKDYLSVPQAKFDLNHAERVRIPVTVSLPKDAEPGGHYGSLLVSIVSDPIEIDSASGAKPGSVVVSRIGTLFFVTTPGGIEHEGQLQKFSTIGDKKLYSTGPVTFGLVSENKGSVHLNPYGEIRIFNMAGNEVGFVELQPWFVMPKSLRLREVIWDRSFLLGRYTAVAKINRGYDDIIDEQTYTFWAIPLKLVALVFGSLFVFFLLLRFILSRFEFKRKGS